ncbi:hypothetical protein M9458_010663, partial [Cirrhinus mrigala]
SVPHHVTPSEDKTTAASVESTPASGVQPSGNMTATIDVATAVSEGAIPSSFTLTEVEVSDQQTPKMFTTAPSSMIKTLTSQEVITSQKEIVSSTTEFSMIRPSHAFTESELTKHTTETMSTSSSKSHSKHTTVSSDAEDDTTDDEGSGVSPVTPVSSAAIKTQTGSPRVRITSTAFTELDRDITRRITSAFVEREGSGIVEDDQETTQPEGSGEEDTSPSPTEEMHDKYTVVTDEAEISEANRTSEPESFVSSFHSTSFTTKSTLLSSTVQTAVRSLSTEGSEITAESEVDKDDDSSGEISPAALESVPPQDTSSKDKSTSTSITQPQRTKVTTPATVLSRTHEALSVLETQKSTLQPSTPETDLNGFALSTTEDDKEFTSPGDPTDKISKTPTTEAYEDLTVRTDEAEIDETEEKTGFSSTVPVTGITDFKHQSTLSPSPSFLSSTQSTATFTTSLSEDGSGEDSTEGDGAEDDGSGDDTSPVTSSPSLSSSKITETTISMTPFSSVDSGQYSTARVVSQGRTTTEIQNVFSSTNTEGLALVSVTAKTEQEHTGVSVSDIAATSFTAPGTPSGHTKLPSFVTPQDPVSTATPLFFSKGSADQQVTPTSPVLIFTEEEEDEDKLFSTVTESMRDHSIKAEDFTKDDMIIDADTVSVLEHSSPFAPTVATEEAAGVTPIVMTAQPSRFMIKEPEGSGMDGSELPQLHVSFETTTDRLIVKQTQSTPDILQSSSTNLEEETQATQSPETTNADVPEHTKYGQTSTESTMETLTEDFSGDTLSTDDDILETSTLTPMTSQVFTEEIVSTEEDLSEVSTQASLPLRTISPEVEASSESSDQYKPTQTTMPSHFFGSSIDVTRSSLYVDTVSPEEEINFTGDDVTISGEIVSSQSPDEITDSEQSVSPVSYLTSIASFHIASSASMTKPAKATTSTYTKTAATDDNDITADTEETYMTSVDGTELSTSSTDKVIYGSELTSTEETTSALFSSTVDGSGDQTIEMVAGLSDSTDSPLITEDDSVLSSIESNIKIHFGTTPLPEAITVTDGELFHQALSEMTLTHKPNTDIRIDGDLQSTTIPTPLISASKFNMTTDIVTLVGSPSSTNIPGLSDKTEASLSSEEETDDLMDYDTKTEPYNVYSIPDFMNNTNIEDKTGLDISSEDVTSIDDITQPEGEKSFTTSTPDVETSFEITSQPDDETGFDTTSQPDVETDFDTTSQLEVETTFKTTSESKIDTATVSSKPEEDSATNADEITQAEVLKTETTSQLDVETDFETTSQPDVETDFETTSQSDVETSFETTSQLEVETSFETIDTGIETPKPEEDSATGVDGTTQAEVLSSETTSQLDSETSFKTTMQPDIESETTFKSDASVTSSPNIGTSDSESSTSGEVDHNTLSSNKHHTTTRLSDVTDKPSSAAALSEEKLLEERVEHTTQSEQTDTGFRTTTQPQYDGSVTSSSLKSSSEDDSFIIPSSADVQAVILSTATTSPLLLTPVSDIKIVSKETSSRKQEAAGQIEEAVTLPTEIPIQEDQVTSSVPTAQSETATPFSSHEHISEATLVKSSPSSAQNESTTQSTADLPYTMIGQTFDIP